MKLNQATGSLETNAVFTSTKFKVGNAAKIMDGLRNRLYRHKVRTLVQEYICNGRDAMREVKSKGNIDVVLPTIFESTFKVRDYGPGISPMRMSDVFTQFGNSTKDQSNEETGGFGLGAKSAWSYTESFTIVTFIDGIQRSYVAHIGADKEGRLDYLGETKTKEPNGTEIQIAVSPRDINEFKLAAYRATYFWPKHEYPNFKNVNKDDIETYSQGDMLGNLEVNNGLPEFIISNYDKGLVLSIDGIPYVLSQTLADKIASLKALSELVTGQLVLHVNNGDIEVAMSREEVADSKETLDSLESIAKANLGVIKARIAKEFATATSPFEHLTVFVRLKPLYNLKDYRKFASFEVVDSGRGDDCVIQSDLFNSLKAERCEMAAPKFDLTKECLNKKRRRYYSYSNRSAGIKMEWMNVLYYVDGSEPAMITNYRIKSLLQVNPYVIVFTKTDSDSAFQTVIKALGAKPLTAVAYVKPARKSKDAVKIERTKQEFVLHDLGRWRHKAKNTSLASNTKKWLWIDHSKGYDSAAHQALSTYLEGEGWNVCALGLDAQRRVKGDANFKPLSEWLAKFKTTKTIISILKNEKATQNNMILGLKKLKGLTDKTITGMIEEYATLQAGNIPEMLRQIIGVPDEVKEFVKAQKKFEQLINTKYPLLNYIQWDSKINDELVSYMNSK